MTASSGGRVALVGGGPGDPDLITVRGLQCLHQADVIVYDHLVPFELLDRASPAAERIYAGKQAGEHAMRQERINALLVEKAREGRFVVRLKGGDPFVFGRGGEEAIALADAGIPFEVIPGVTAAVSAAAYAGIPVTHRGLASSFVVVTGHPARLDLETVDWERLAGGVDTIAVYMGVGRLSDIAGRLINAGKPPDTPVAVIQWGTTPRQSTLVATLGEISERAAEAEVAPPAIILVGPVVALRSQIAWFEKRQLFGRCLVVLRPEGQADDLVHPLAALGARVIRYPVMRPAPPADPAPFEETLGRLGEADWVLFSSANGVEAFFDGLGRRGLDARALGGIKVGVVGPGTAAAAERRGLRPDFVARTSVAEAFAGELSGREDLRGRRVLIPQAADARTALAEVLTGAGARVTAVEAYRMVPVDRSGHWLTTELDGGRVDGILFTSSSTVRYFLLALERDGFEGFPPSCRLISIGPVTSGTIKRFGGVPAAEAESHDIPGLVAAVERLYEGSGSDREAER